MKYRSQKAVEEKIYFCYNSSTVRVFENFIGYKGNLDARFSCISAKKIFLEGGNAYAIKGVKIPKLQRHFTARKCCFISANFGGVRF